MIRLGIFGGAFDPPHVAHSIIADDIREQMHLDKIIFIPAGNPPLKDNSKITSSHHRFEMAKLAFEGDENFEVSGIEMEDPGKKSYTVDTLIKLRENYEKDTVKFYLIIGIDNLIDLPKWKNPEKLFLLSQVLVMNRPNYFIHDVLPEYSEKVKFLNVPNLQISSSAIREKISKGRSIRYLVKPGVEKYIKENKLYISS